MKEITQELLKELLHYDPSTGVFTWKHRNEKYFDSNRYYKVWNTRYSNTKAGSISASGNNGTALYIKITVLYKKCFSHRLAWLYVYGVFPKSIDHINGNGLDNRIINLRDVPQNINNKNTKLPSSNTSGSMGVYWNKVRNKWVAGIQVDGKGYNLGGYESIDDAKKARKEAEKKYNFHENHGRKS